MKDQRIISVKRLFACSATLALIAVIGVTVAVSAVGHAATPAQVQHACGALFAGHRAASTAPAPPDAVRSQYAVLRRAQTPADLPRSSAVLESAISGSLSAYDPVATRRLAISLGGAFYLVSGTPRTYHPSAACRRVLPAALRSVLASDEARFGSGPAYCLVALTAAGNSTTGESCGGYALVAGGFAYSVTAGPGPPEAALFGLVPDGVGVASLTFEDPQTTVNLPVTDNLATGPRPAGYEHRISILSKLLAKPNSPRRRLRALVAAAIPTRVTWYSANRATIVRVLERPPGLVTRTLRLLLAASTLAKSTTTTAGSCTLTTVKGRQVERCTTCAVKIVSGQHNKTSCVTTTHPRRSRR